MRLNWNGSSNIEKRVKRSQNVQRKNSTLTLNAAEILMRKNYREFHEIGFSKT